MRTLRPTLLRGRLPPPLQHHQRRTFLPNPFTHASSPLSSTSSPAHLTASRTLPYPSSALFNLIADVPAYAAFLPYCQASTVTRWSAPDKSGKRWPSEATLVIGFSGLSEGFKSKVYCKPPEGEGVGIVEAVAGAAETALGESEVGHHFDVQRSQDVGGLEARDAKDAADAHLLSHLLTRWTLRPFMFKPPPADAHPHEMTDKEPVPQTECMLSIEYAFRNPVYGALSAGAAPRVAETMIRAFEARAREVLGEPGERLGPGMGGTGERGWMEGVVKR